MRFALLGLIPVLAVACGDGDGGNDTGPSGPCDEGPATVDPGVGEFTLEVLNGGESVNMVHGPQGGWHVDTAALIGNTGDVVQIVPSLLLTESGESIAGVGQVAETIALAAYDDEICEGNIVAIRAYVDDVQHPAPYSDHICSLEGKEVELTLTVTDVVTGDSGSGSVEFILHIDPNDADLCSQ